MTIIPVITQDRVKQLLAYNPETGDFRWKVARGRMRAWSVAGHVCANGYRSIKIDTHDNSAHRLAWLFVHGVWPPVEIDHINRNKADNRLCNLRLATSSENKWNMGKPRTNTSGVKGVCWDNRNRNWEVKFNINGIKIYIGRFDTLEAAASAYAQASAIHHGEFGRVA